jgi:hypothetical protein
MNTTIDSLSHAFQKLLSMRLLLVLTAAIILQVLAGTAYAASLTVTVKQVNPNSAAQTVTCTLLQKNCDLPFVMNAGTASQQSLNIHVAYFDGGLALNFQTVDGYFSTANKVGNTTIYNTMWNRKFQGSTPATFNIALFRPLAQNLFTPISPSIKYTPVANLEITAIPAS